MPHFKTKEALAEYFEDIKLRHARAARLDKAEQVKWERKWGDNFRRYADAKRAENLADKGS